MGRKEEEKRPRAKNANTGLGALHQRDDIVWMDGRKAASRCWEGSREAMYRDAAVGMREGASAASTEVIGTSSITAGHGEGNCNEQSRYRVWILFVLQHGILN